MRWGQGSYNSIQPTNIFIFYAHYKNLAINEKHNIPFPSPLPRPFPLSLEAEQSLLLLLLLSQLKKFYLQNYCKLREIEQSKIKQIGY